MKEYQTYRLFPSSVFHFKLENYKELNTELENYVVNLKKKFKDGQKNQTLEDGILHFLILLMMIKMILQKNFFLLLKKKYVKLLMS